MTITGTAYRITVFGTASAIPTCGNPVRKQLGISQYPAESLSHRMISTSEIPDRVLLYCESMQYKDSRRLEPDEHRRLGALRVELANRAKAGKWQMPLMVLFVIALILAFRIIGLIIAALVLNVWLPKYRTAREFTKSLGSEGVEPVVDRFVAIEGDSIDGLFVNEKPRPVKPNQYVMTEMEVLARSEERRVGKQGWERC